MALPKMVSQPQNPISSSLFGKGAANDGALVRRLLLPAAISGALLATAACAFLYGHDTGQIEQRWRERESVRVRMFSELFSSNFHNAARDVLILSTGDALQTYFRDGDVASLDRAASRAQVFSHGQADYDQIRFVDNKGDVIFRVNRNGQRVAPEELQDKAEREFFVRASALAPDAILISPMELNAGKGGIEKPFKPIVRFACPVFDATGTRRGIYVINLLVGGILDRLEQWEPANTRRARVLNATGFWLKTADSAQEWGFMLPGRAGMTMAQTDPGLWLEVSHGTSGQVAHRGGLFTWRQVVPSELVSGAGMSAAVAAEPFLVVASEIPKGDWTSYFLALRESYSAIAIALLFMIGVTCWFVRARELARLEQDRFFTLSLDLLCIASSDGYFKRVSVAVTDILGWSVREFLSRPFIDFIHPDDHAATIEEVRKQVVEGKKVFHFENRYRASDGSWRVLSWRSIPFPGGFMYATARDVTELKRSENQIRQLNTDLQVRAVQLESANRELEAFSYSVSHDLRAPLRHIDGFAGLLGKLDGPSLSERGRTYLTQISASAKQMGVLIDDLLSFSRMGRSELHVAQVDLNSLLEETLVSLRPETEGRTITWTIGKLPTVTGDRSMLRQVLLNLLGNAIKYSGKRATAAIEVGCLATALEDVIFVRDNGVGFDMEYAKKLFGVFQRLHLASEFEGTGIGLANVRRVVSRHGGRTWAEGKPNEGATFYFSLPKSIALHV
jgi:PAS domain S-box-containing protein